MYFLCLYIRPLSLPSKHTATEKKTYRWKWRGFCLVSFFCLATKRFQPNVSVWAKKCDSDLMSQYSIKLTKPLFGGVVIENQTKNSIFGFPINPFDSTKVLLCTIVTCYQLLQKAALRSSHHNDDANQATVTFRIVQQICRYSVQ